ncbi:MAG TPA: GNAT family N-acetyltransferase [Firmicutes bacterium]|nr:GNAT family N-acetyltransferase [Bacillota bacterium]
MKGLKLVTPTIEHKEAWIDIVTEIEAAGEKMTPLALKGDTDDFDTFLEGALKNAQGIDLPMGRVRATVLFLIKEGEPKILGAIDIRHDLNEYLLKVGGHIGYGIRPSERKKGYATVMLHLALTYCKELGLERVLITCDKTNIGSAKTMIKNGAMLENEIEHNGIVTQRYWINLRNEALS